MQHWHACEKCRCIEVDFELSGYPTNQELTQAKWPKGWWI